MRTPLVAVTTALVLAVPATTATATPAHTRPVTAWLTTGDQANLLADRTDLVGPSDAASPTIAVDPSRRFQTVEGFGASITDSSAHLIAKLPGRDRRTLMRELFEPRTGLGLSYLRQPIGSSDFVAGEHYTYNDLPAGRTDYQMRHFSIDRDRKEIIPLLREARALNPNLKIMASPWSPPAWMKTSGSLVGGRLKDDERVYRAYAKYLATFVGAYARAGVRIDAITLQNEPQNRTPDGYPGMDLRHDEAIRLIPLVGRELRAAGLSTELLGYDHNWSLHPNDGGPADDPANPDYAESLLDDPTARRWLAGTAFHCYSGDPERQSRLHDLYPDKDIYFTECSPNQSSDPTTTFSDTLHWQTRQVTVWGMRHWAKTAIGWNLALDPSGGPHNGGCATCFGTVTIDPESGEVTPTAHYYVAGHGSKFLRPGAVRVDSTAYAGSVTGVAFRNPDGNIVLIAVNDDWGAGEQRFNVTLGARSFSYTLPAGAVATFTLR
ncbi:glucosylceramidase [Streptosporangium oxazolinicum]|uniref:Glucosylceramidase n=1 Tax=Streptosporangium oxazolinicum TaxID=909287 RepID=A0ABP8APT0_9ACTN